LVVLVTDLSQVQFRVSQAAAEAVANLLHELGGGGVEQRDGETIDKANAGAVELITWVASSDVEQYVGAVEKLLGSLKDMGVDTEPFSWEQREADPEAWVDVYKQHFRTARIAKRFIVKPSWEDYTPQSGDLMIELDPGMAFGTGLHASTKLVMSCLDRIARLCPTPNTVLDLGCGTGILAIAAAKLWSPSKIIAVDNDPTAVEVCKENVARNGLSSRIEVKQGSAGSVDGRFSLVLANLSYDVLSGLTSPLLRNLDDFGRIVLSGLLAEQAKRLCADFARQLVLEPEYSEEEAGWRALMMRVRA
jgi:ribosomal protein L11 methyltransferase